MIFKYLQSPFFSAFAFSSLCAIQANALEIKSLMLPPDVDPKGYDYPQSIRDGFMHGWWTGKDGHGQFAHLNVQLGGHYPDNPPYAFSMFINYQNPEASYLLIDDLHPITLSYSQTPPPVSKMGLEDSMKKSRIKVTTVGESISGLQWEWTQYNSDNHIATSHGFNYSNDKGWLNLPAFSNSHSIVVLTFPPTDSKPRSFLLSNEVGAASHYMNTALYETGTDQLMPVELGVNLDKAIDRGATYDHQDPDSYIQNIAYTEQEKMNYDAEDGIVLKCSRTSHSCTELYLDSFYLSCPELKNNQKVNIGLRIKSGFNEIILNHNQTTFSETQDSSDLFHELTTTEWLNGEQCNGSVLSTYHSLIAMKEDHSAFGLINPSLLQSYVQTVTGEKITISLIGPPKTIDGFFVIPYLSEEQNKPNILGFVKLSPSEKKTLLDLAFSQPPTVKREKPTGIYTKEQLSKGGLYKRPMR